MNEVKQEVIQNIPENQTKIDTNESAPIIKTEENQNNWKKFREDRERERKEMAEAQASSEKHKKEAEALKAALEAIIDKPNTRNNENHYDNDQETEEQKIEKKVQIALEKERKRYEDEKKANETKNLPQTLSRAIPDFNQVCSSENLDYLEYHHPEIANAFRHMPDGFDKWESVYKSVKKLVPFQNKKEDQKRIENNMKKPQANIPNVTESQQEGSAWKLSEERKKENWKRMQKDMKSFK